MLEFAGEVVAVGFAIEEVVGESIASCGECGGLLIEVLGVKIVGAKDADGDHGFGDAVVEEGEFAFLAEDGSSVFSDFPELGDFLRRGVAVESGVYTDLKCVEGTVFEPGVVFGAVEFFSIAEVIAIQGLLCEGERRWSEEG